jgi:hypothetical protein
MKKILTVINIAWEHVRSSSRTSRTAQGGEGIHEARRRLGAPARGVAVDVAGLRLSSQSPAHRQVASAFCNDFALGKRFSFSTARHRRTTRSRSSGTSLQYVDGGFTGSLIRAYMAGPARNLRQRSPGRCGTPA